MIMCAERVVAQCFDHTAILDGAAGAVIDHSPQLQFQRLQAGYANLNGFQLRLGDVVDSGTRLVGTVGHAEKIADRLDREAKLARVADEGKAVLRGSVVEPLVARAAVGFGEKSDLFVEADGRHLDASYPSQPADGQATPYRTAPCCI